MTFEVVFEKKFEDGWHQVPSDALQEGDITRMKASSSGVDFKDDGEEFRVAKRRGEDPDSSRRFDIALEPI